MVNIFVKPDPLRQAFPLPVAAYEHLGEFGLLPRKTELVRGVIFEKPAKSPLFCFLENTLSPALRHAIADPFIVRTGQPLSLTDSCPEPDLAVVEKNAHHYQRHHPTTALFLIEIAIATKALDRAKAAIYAEAGVEQYWIVLPDNGSIECFTQPEAGKYARHAAMPASQAAVSTVIPGFKFDLTAMLNGG